MNRLPSKDKCNNVRVSFELKNRKTIHAGREEGILVSAAIVVDSRGQQIHHRHFALELNSIRKRVPTLRIVHTDLTDK